jgi:hypothetical protein
MLENPLQLIKSCKGAALSILVIMTFEKKPVGQEFLECWSGYTDKTITQALAYLAESNLVMQINRYSWQLTSYAQQLPLMQTLDSGSRNFSDSRASVVVNVESRRESLTTEDINNRSRKFSDSIEASDTKINRDFTENRKLLRADGVFEPKASQLAKLPWITPDYLKAFIEDRKRSGNSIALMIYQISNQNPPPARNKEPDYRSYITGEYAHLIQH